MKISATIGMGAIVIASAFADPMFAGETEVKIAMDQVPAAVREAVKKYANDAEIKAVLEVNDDGTKIIEFDIEKNGKKSEVGFHKDGKLFMTEEEIALADVPSAVQKTIAKKSKDAKAGTPFRVVKEGTTRYEVVIEKNGEKTEYSVSAEGKTLSKQVVKD